MPKFAGAQTKSAFRRGVASGNKDESPNKMLAAQAIKQRRALEEDLHHHDHHHRHGEHEDHEHGGYTSNSDDEDEVKEETPKVEVPKYLHGIPLVDTHSIVDGTYVVMAKNLAGVLQVNRFSSTRSCFMFGPRNKLRKLCCFIVTHQIFELIILITILTNCIFLALNDPPSESEIVFAVIYTSEMIFKVIAKGFAFHKFAYLRNSWNWLDFVCVIIGYLTFIPGVSNFSVVRTFRVLRALRTISAVKGLKAMVNTLMKSIKMLSDVMILTTFFICVFALIGLQLFKGSLHNKCVKDAPSNLTHEMWKNFTDDEHNWLINNDFPFVCGNTTYGGHCPENYTCLKDIKENPPKTVIPFISFDNFLWSLLTSLQVVTLDSWEIVYNVVIGANGQVYVLYFLFVVLLGPFYLINLVLAVVSLSYEIESQSLQDEDLREQIYLGLKRSASTYDFDLKEMPEPLYLDDVPQRPEESKYEPDNEVRPPSRNTSTPTSNNALELGENYAEQDPPPEPGCLGSCRLRLFWFVNGAIFEGFITACILLNTMCMSLEYHKMDLTFKEVLNKCNLVFTIVFILEMILKLLALGVKKYVKVAWNLFDGFIVLMSIVDLTMEHAKVEGGAGGALSVLRTFRLLRVLKLAKSWKTMGNLLATIGKSVGAVGNITVILLILMFIFAVVGMQLFRNYYTEEFFPEGVPRWNFQDFPKSFMMVFRIICGKWIEPCWDVMRVAGEHSFLYVLFVFVLGQWIVLTLFLALLLSSFGGDSLSDENGEKQEKKKKKKFNFLDLFRKKKNGRVTPNNSKEDLEGKEEGEGEEIKEDLCDENHDPALTPMANGKGADLGNMITQRADSGERSDEGSIKNGSVEGDPSQSEFPVSVVVDETKENHLNGNNNGSNGSTELLNVANGGGHSVPNGNSHKGSMNELKRTTSGLSQSSVSLNESRRDSCVNSSLGVGTNARNSSIRGSRRPTMMIQSEDGSHVAQDCYPGFCYKNGLCCICPPGFKTTKIRKLWMSMRVKVNFFVEHKYFESFILFLIVISSLSLAVEDVYLPERPHLKQVLEYMNIFFAVVFTLEFLLKLIGYGVVGYFTSFWNLLDVFIVAISLATLIGNAENLNALRSLRALRPLRAVSKFEGMKVVINSLVLSIPAIGNVVLVCLVFWLIFSIMGYQFFGGKFYRCVDDNKVRLLASVVANRTQCVEKGYRWVNAKINYDSAIDGFLALFEVATLEGYMEVIFDSVDAVEIDQQPIQDNNYAINIFYVVFITLGSFFILNLFVGVVIENFSKLKQQYEDSDAMGMFLTPSQRIWVNTMCRTYMKKPRRQPKRPDSEWRGKIYDLIQSRPFEFFIMTIILLNIITMMGEHYKQSDQFQEGLDYLNYIFTVLFIIEAILRLLALRSEYFKSGWNLFDFTIVIFSITEIILDSYEIKMPFSPGLLRVVRVFRLARLLRFFEGAKGIRSLLFALVKSLPGLANIGCLLFLFMFIYACIGMSLWGNVKHTGYLDDVVNFRTFFSSLLLLFRIATAAGWNTILEPMMVEPPDCDDKYKGMSGGNCGQPLLAVIYFVSYILLIFLVTVNMYIAVILDNFNEAQQQDEIGLCEEDMDAYIASWEAYDTEATQFIHYRELTHFLDNLDPPLRIPKPNEEEFANMNVPVRQGDLVHCLDLMLALVRRVIGDMEDLSDEDKANMYEKYEERFSSTFPMRRARPKLYTILQRYKQETAAAIRLQRAFREIQKKREDRRLREEKFHKYEEEKAEKDNVWREKQLEEGERPGSASSRPRTASSPRKRAPLAKQETIESPLPSARIMAVSPAVETNPPKSGLRETAENFKNDPFTAEAMNMMWFTRGGNGQNQKSSESAV